ncbi:MAG: class I SAM-dependent methyltransferase [Candidatus Omnitrophota bacterium]
MKKGCDEAIEEIRCNLCGNEKTTPFVKVLGYQLVRCKTCGLVFVNPRPSQEKIERQYAEEYHRSCLFEQFPGTDEEKEAAIHRYDAPAENLVKVFGTGKRLLEIGCSAGFLLANMKRRGWEVTGLDVSEWAATYAREKLGVPCYVGTVESASLTGQYDLIILFHTIEHFSDPLGSLKKIGSLFARDGGLVIKSPNVASFDRIWHGKRWMGLHPPFDLYYFSPASYKKMLKKAGFVIERMVFQYWNPLIHLIEMRMGDGLRADHDPDKVITFDKQRIRRSPVYQVLNGIWELMARILHLTGRDVTIYARRQENR